MTSIVQAIARKREGNREAMERDCVSSVVLVELEKMPGNFSPFDKKK